VYRHTVCQTCGVDEGVAVRYWNALLCLDCYRRTSRQDRALLRQARALVRELTALYPKTVSVQRLAHLCAAFPVGASTGGHGRPGADASH